MSPTNSIRLLNSLCDAFGLPETVRSLTLRVDVNNVATVTTEQIATSDESQGVKRILTTDYMLVQKHTAAGE